MYVCIVFIWKTDRIRVLHILITLKKKRYIIFFPKKISFISQLCNRYYEDYTFDINEPEAAKKRYDAISQCRRVEFTEDEKVIGGLTAYILPNYKSRRSFTFSDLLFKVSCNIFQPFIALVMLVNKRDFYKFICTDQKIYPHWRQFEDKS